MEHQTAMSMISSSKINDPLACQTVAKRLTDEGFRVLKQHLKGEASYELTSAQWQILTQAAESVGYELGFKLDKEQLLCVSTSRIGAKPIPLNLSFCFACGDLAHQMFANLLWCDKCLQKFLKEVL